MMHEGQVESEESVDELQGNNLDEEEVYVTTAKINLWHLTDNQHRVCACVCEFPSCRVFSWSRLVLAFALSVGTGFSYVSGGFGFVSIS